MSTKNKKTLINFRGAPVTNNFMLPENAIVNINQPMLHSTKNISNNHKGAMSTANMMLASIQGGTNSSHQFKPQREHSYNAAFNSNPMVASMQSQPNLIHFGQVDGVTVNYQSQSKPQLPTAGDMIH